MMNKKNKIEKPSAEAKALSLFFMAYKAKNPVYKEQAKRLNKQWDLLKSEEISRKAYDGEVQRLLKIYGGYEMVLEKTVRYYIETTGAWTLKGDDKYNVDANEMAAKILSE